MSYIVLEETLINEFLKFYYKDDYDSEIIHNLFNHFKPFLITNKQLTKFFSGNDVALQQVLSTQIPYCEYIDTISEPYSYDFYNEMLEQSKYKILLTKNSSSLNMIDCHKICINDKPTHIYAKKFESKGNRSNAKKHLISLMKNAGKVTVIDKYLYKNDIIKNIIEWFTESNLNTAIAITLYGEEKQLKFNEIKAKFEQKDYKNITCKSIEKYTHDRYIIIDDKISINLTSGIENLFNNDKDFTYIVSEI